MKIDTSNWKEFLVQEVFNCETTIAVDANIIEIGKIPSITRSSENNGCSGKLNNIENINKGNCLTIGAEGKFDFYKKDDFIAGVKIYTLRIKFLNQYNALFLATILNTKVALYSYGRARILKKIKQEIIKLPVNKNGEPDFEFMENYIKSLHCKPITTKVKKQNIQLQDSLWQEFLVSDVFTVKYGVNLELINCEFADKNDEDSINFVARTSENNGVVTQVKKIKRIKPQTAGTITCAGSGSVLSTFVQNKEFYSGRDLYTFTPKQKMEIYSKLFCITIIEAYKYRFSYGRQANKSLSNLLLKLPSKNDGTSDFDYMENYIKSLPYSDRI